MRFAMLALAALSAISAPGAGYPSFTIDIDAGTPPGAGDVAAERPFPPASATDFVEPAFVVTAESFDRAADYSASFDGVALLVMTDGSIAHERYAYGPNLPIELASGTKSFSGVLACLAVADGLFELDDRVSDTIVEWKSDPRKSAITVRQLLSLTSGIEAGDVKGDVPTYAQAVASKSVTAPGAAFAYGANAFQVFGEFVKRALTAAGSKSRDALDYLEERLFGPIGLVHGEWTRGEDGNPHLPSGARLAARQWAKFGEFVRLDGTWRGKRLLPAGALDACFEGSVANPAYGLTWWLNREVPADTRESIRQLNTGTDISFDDPWIPKDLVFAAGAGKQRLYVIRSLGMVIVRQAKGIREALTGESRKNSFSDREFFALLFGIK